MNAIRANNVIATVGKTENDLQQFNLLSNTTLQTAEDFQRLVIAERDGVVIHLGDVARVEVGETRGTENARYNQDITIYLAIEPMPGANEIEIGDEVYEKLDVDQRRRCPKASPSRSPKTARTYMRDSLREIFTTLFETIALVSIVVLVADGLVQDLAGAARRDSDFDPGQHRGHPPCSGSR